MKTPKNLIQILNQSLWLNENLKINNTYLYNKQFIEKGILHILLNENLKINNTYLYNKQFIDKGILHIKDILDDNSNFLNHIELTSKYKLITNFIEYLLLKSCIPREWKDQISKVKLSANKIQDGNCIEINNKYMNIDKIQCKYLYWHLIEKYQHNPKCRKAFIKKFSDRESVNNKFWKRIFNLPFSTTRETKIQSFQFRIIHKIIP